MNTILALIAASAMPLAAHTPEALPDTVLTVNAPESVVITESPAGMTVMVDDAEAYTRKYAGDSRVSVTQRWEKSPSQCATVCCLGDNSRNDITVGGLYFGFTAPTSHMPGMDIEMGKSFDIGILNLVNYRRQVPMKGGFAGGFNVGFGLNWRIYSSTRGPRFITDDKGNLFAGSWEGDDVLRSKASRLNTFSMQFPVIWTQSFPGRIFGATPQLSVGAILNWNTSAVIRDSWLSTSGGDMHSKTDGLHQRRVTCDLYASMRICPCLSIYARYTPTPLFSPTHGPELKPITIGIIIN